MWECSFVVCKYSLRAWLHLLLRSILINRKPKVSGHAWEKRFVWSKPKIYMHATAFFKCRLSSCLFSNVEKDRQSCAAALVMKTLTRHSFVTPCKGCRSIWFVWRFRSWFPQACCRQTSTCNAILSNFLSWRLYKDNVWRMQISLVHITKIKK